MKKSLLISSKVTTAPQEPGVWANLDSVGSLIEGIETPEVNIDTDDVTNIISGIPTPWARATIFRYAIEAGASQQVQTTGGITTFYDLILDEWKALLAFIVLHNDRIEVEELELSSSYEAAMANLFEFKAALGTMLFNDRIFWKKPSQRNDPDASSYIQVIKYVKSQDQKIVIGATCPFSLVFTPPEIYMEEGTALRFYDNHRKRWKNPCVGRLTLDEVQRIYDYVSYIKNNLGEFQHLLNHGNSRSAATSSVRGEFSSVALEECLEQYSQELRNYAQKRIRGTGLISSPTLRLNNLLNTRKHFEEPFDTIFNADAKLYHNGTAFVQNWQTGFNEETIVEDLLSESNTVLEIVFSSLDEPERCGAYMLKIPRTRNEDKDRYFAIPLSDKGVLLFQGQMQQLLEGKNRQQEFHHLYASFTEEGDVKIVLRIRFSIGNNEYDYTEVEKVYSLRETSRLMREHVMIWPNFVSKRWAQYYLYSDLPHNSRDSEVTVMPILGELKDGELKFMEDSQKDINAIQHRRVFYPNSERVINDKNITCGVVVNQLAGQTDGLRYEIYESNVPFIGVELRYGSINPQVSGYLLAKAINRNDAGSLALYGAEGVLNRGVVGVDFGSNNTCVSFFSSEETALKLVKFHNRRVSFLGSDRTFNATSQHNDIARGFELFFFQKEEPEGQIKSMLVAHDPNRLETFDSDVSKEVRGGFPVFEKNLPLRGISNESSEFNYELALGANLVLLKHNMKWSTYGRNNDYKYSFLKTLWLQILAELFSQSHQVTELKWAYPGAMSLSIVQHYRTMWLEVVESVLPIKQMALPRINNMTEGEAVSRFAVHDNTVKMPGGGLAIDGGSLGIGYDVGGSTTDILMIMRTNSDEKERSQDLKWTLVKESSIMVAASALAEATKRNQRIQKTLQRFLADRGIHFFGIDKMNQDTAGYYLNATFDRLDESQLRDLYSYFHRRGCLEMFAIASYVTGLILYYTGQLAGRILRREGRRIDRFVKGFYGKGGNIFNWILAVMPEEGRKYYADCFFAGVGESGYILSVADLNRVRNEYSGHDSWEVIAQFSYKVKEELSGKWFDKEEELKEALSIIAVSFLEGDDSNTPSKTPIEKENDFVDWELEKTKLSSRVLRKIKETVVSSLAKGEDGKYYVDDNMLEALEEVERPHIPEILIDWIDDKFFNTGFDNSAEFEQKIAHLFVSEGKTGQLPSYWLDWKQVRASLSSRKMNRFSKYLEESIVYRESKYSVDLNQVSKKDLPHKLLEVIRQLLKPAQEKHSLLENIKHIIDGKEDVLQLGQNDSGETKKDSTLGLVLEEIQQKIIEVAKCEFNISANTTYKAVAKHNKSEVSFGLSSPESVYIPPRNDQDGKTRGIPEIIGEDGYMYRGNKLSYLDEISPKLLSEYGGDLVPPKEFTKLQEYVDIYCRFIRKNSLMNQSVIQKGVKELPRNYFATYINSLPQYKKARDRGEDFDFQAPLIVLEGMCLLDSVIFPECFGNI